MTKNDKDKTNKQQYTKHNVENFGLSNTNSTKNWGVISGAPAGYAYVSTIPDTRLILKVVFVKRGEIVFGLGQPTRDDVRKILERAFTI